MSVIHSSPCLLSLLRSGELLNVFDFEIFVIFYSKIFEFFFSVLQGNLRPEEALQSLTIYEGNFSRLKDEREKCARAKEALELTDTGVFSGSEERVQVLPTEAAITAF